MNLILALIIAIIILIFTLAAVIGPTILTFWIVTILVIAASESWRSK